MADEVDDTAVAISENKRVAGDAAMLVNSSEKLRINGETSFGDTMEELRKCSWYWGPISWEEAESVLSSSPPGSFLLRDSKNERYIFTLSFKTSNSINHARLPQHAGKFCFGGPRSLLSGSNILEFIEKTVEHSSEGRLHLFLHPRGGEETAESIRLLHPVSRNSLLPSLRHLSRFRILTRIRFDQIDTLPLPERLKMYLRDPNYIAEMA